MHISAVEALHWGASIIAAATVALLVMPTPDTFKELLLLNECPRSYVVIYNLVRYVANVNYKAGYQQRTNGNTDQK